MARKSVGMNDKSQHMSMVLGDSVGAGFKPARIDADNRDKNRAGSKPAPTKELPEGWVWKRLGDACNVILGQSPESVTYNMEKEGLPFFQGKAEFGDRIPTVAKWCTAPKKVAKKNDILISVRAPVGPTNLAPSECCIGRGLAALRPLDDSNCLYLLHYLRSIEHKLSEMGTGTTFKAISGDVLRSIEIPLAPLSQQHIIVAEIEKQCSRRGEAVPRPVLSDEPSNRATHRIAPTKDTKYEIGADLLKRILVERKKKWEEKNPGKKYKEPVAPDASNMPVLPKGWVWCGFEQVSVADGITITSCGTTG